ncbi:hypothetical protein SDC9_179797 [bioreactor metagenome]|uniref:Uncharacterized protein n=1 Tax=bioreactor metagenome TaxID=1076179 RepID=A0A645H2U3_9ZZZZ
MRHRLAAGEGQPAAGGLVENTVFQYLLHHGVDTHHFSDGLQRAGVTNRRALPAANAAAPIEAVAGCTHAVTVVRAGRDARAAADAAVGGEKKLPFRRPGLRVVTPDAAERAPLEEHDSPDAGAVVSTEPFDVEDGSGDRGVHRQPSFGGRWRRKPRLCSSR